MTDVQTARLLDAPDRQQDDRRGHHWHLPDDETQRLRYTVRMLTAERDRLRRQEARCHALLDAVCGYGDEALVGRVAHLVRLYEMGGCPKEGNNDTV